jgi:NDP-sugar pyrophosphorylase family protein
MNIPANINVVILAGGVNTRLRSIVNVRPKVMALIGGRPFSTYILDQINHEGSIDVILCVGYMGKYIEAEMGETYGNLTLHYSYEHEPRGTGGAIRNTPNFINSDTILIMGSI